MKEESNKTELVIVEKVRAMAKKTIPDLETFNTMQEESFDILCEDIEEKYGTEYLEVLQVYIQELHGV